MTVEQAQEIGRLVAEGYTSGRLDDESSCMAWELKTNEWSDDDDSNQT